MERNESVDEGLFLSLCINVLKLVDKTEDVSLSKVELGLSADFTFFWEVEPKKSLLKLVEATVTARLNPETKPSFKHKTRKWTEFK